MFEHKLIISYFLTWQSTLPKGVAHLGHRKGQLAPLQMFLAVIATGWSLYFILPLFVVVLALEGLGRLHVPSSSGVDLLKIHLDG